MSNPELIKQRQWYFICRQSTQIYKLLLADDYNSESLNTNKSCPATSLTFSSQLALPKNNSPNFVIFYRLDRLIVSQIIKSCFFCLAVISSIQSFPLTLHCKKQEETNSNHQQFASKSQLNIQVHCLPQNCSTYNYLSFSFQYHVPHFLLRPHWCL